MTRGSRLDWRVRRGLWASTGRGADRITRPVPTGPAPLRRLPSRRDSAGEVEESPDRWIIEDLEPLQHEERFR